MDPYAHPLHMKVVKHLVYLWHRRVIHYGWVSSINACVMVQFVTSGWGLFHFAILVKQCKCGTSPDKSRLLERRPKSCYQRVLAWPVPTSMWGGAFSLQHTCPTWAQMARAFFNLRKYAHEYSVTMTLSWYSQISYLQTKKAHQTSKISCPKASTFHCRMRGILGSICMLYWNIGKGVEAMNWEGARLNCKLPSSSSQGSGQMTESRPNMGSTFGCQCGDK